MELDFFSVSGDDYAYILVKRDFLLFFHYISEWFIHLPGRAVMMEAEALLQREISHSYCIIGIQYLMCGGEYDSHTEHFCFFVVDVISHTVGLLLGHAAKCVEIWEQMFFFATVNMFFLKAQNATNMVWRRIFCAVKTSCGNWKLLHWSFLKSFLLLDFPVLWIMRNCRIRQSVAILRYTKTKPYFEGTLEQFLPGPPSVLTDCGDVPNWINTTHINPVTLS